MQFFSFVPTLQNLVYILYLQHISVHTSFRCSIATHASGCCIISTALGRFIILISKLFSSVCTKPSLSLSSFENLSFLLAPLFPSFFPNILYSFSPFLSYSNDLYKTLLKSSEMRRLEARKKGTKIT